MLSGFAWPQRIELLLAQLENSHDLAVKVDAVRLLGRIAPQRAEQSLRAAAQAEEPELRAAAAEVLGRAGLGRDLLRALLSDTSPMVREQAANGLALMHDDASCDLVARTLSDEESSVRAASVHALSQLCGEDKKAAIQALLEDSSAQVVQAAREAIARVDAASGPGCETSSRASREGAPKTPWFAWLLKSGDRRLSAQQAAETLDQLEDQLPDGEALAADPLLDWLPRAPHGLKARIATLLVETRAQVDSVAVARLLPNAERDLKLVLLELLRAQKAEPALVPLLWPLLHHADPLVRERSAAAMGAHADASATRALGAALSDNLGAEREAVATALAFALRRTSTQLSHWAQWRLKRNLRRALRTSSESSGAQLVRALTQLDVHYAARELASQRTFSLERRVALLRATANDRGVAARSVRALYAASSLPIEASTAFTAQLLANDLDDRSLIARLDDTRWPAAPIAAFGLTRRGEPLALSLQQEVCAHVRAARDPLTRLNLRLAITRRNVRCSDSGELRDTEIMLVSRPSLAPMTFRALLIAGGGVLPTVSDGAGRADWDQLVFIGEQSLWRSPYRAFE